MSLRTVLSTLGVTSFLFLMTSEASATLTRTTANNSINAKAATYSSSWLGTGPSLPSPGLTSCSDPNAPCAGWYKLYSGGPKIFSWDDAGTTRTNIVHGMILGRYDALSDANGLLGFPITDELDAPGGTGRYNDFHGGSIYYKWGASAAYEVHGWIKTKWKALGGTASVLGYPTSNETSYALLPGGRYNAFEHGWLIYDGHAGSWQADTWPLMTEETPAPVMSSGPWITARSKGTDGSHYLVGCGFTPSSTINLYQNSRDARTQLANATADASGCFGFATEYSPGAIPYSRTYNNIVTYEARSSSGSSFAAVGVPYYKSQSTCYAVSPTYGTMSYYMVNKTDRFTWCVSYDSWKNRHDQLVDYLTFPDDVLGQLESYFTVSYSAGRQVAQVDEIHGGCGSPTDFGAGFFLPGGTFDAGNPWAHICSVQEITNSYTADVAGGWPRDWWADHKSPFPIFVNWNILDDLGITDAYTFDYALQHGPGPSGNTGTDMDPWYVSSSGFQQWDPQEKIFRYLEALGGWAMFGSMFQYLDQDQIRLEVAAPAQYNISELRSEYVVAYMSLGYGTNLTDFVSQYRVGQRPMMYFDGVAADCWRADPNGNDVFGCATTDVTENGQLIKAWDRPWTDYAVSAAKVTQIADAHCRIASAVGESNQVAAALDALQNGDPAGAIATLNGAGACDGNCPAECGCYVNKCSAPWAH